MAKELLSDELWAVLEPFLPPPPPRPKGGRPRLPNRAILTGILFVLKSGIPWELLPPEMGCGSGMTCWRRLRDWHAQGVWRRLHQELLDCLGEADQLDWTRAAIEAALVPAPGGAKPPGPTRGTAANRARSALWWSTGKEFRWPLSSRRLTFRTARGWKPRSMPWSPSSAQWGGPASGPPSCMPTRPTMRQPSVRS
jgi:transposase